MKFFNVIKTAFVGAVGLLVSGAASAASVLTAADKTAITGGFTNLNDTVLDIVGTSWGPGLSMLAILMAPVIVHKVIKLFSK